MESTANLEPEYDTPIEIESGTTVEVELDDSTEPAVLRITRTDDETAEFEAYRITVSYPIDFYAYAPASEYQSDWLDLREHAITELLVTRFASVGQTAGSSGWTAMGYDFVAEHTGELTYEEAIIIGESLTSTMKQILSSDSFHAFFAQWTGERVFASAPLYSVLGLSSQDIRDAVAVASVADPVPDTIARAIAVAAAGAGRPALTSLANNSYVSFDALQDDLDRAKADVQDWHEAAEMHALSDWATDRHTTLERV